MLLKVTSPTHRLAALMTHLDELLNHLMYLMTMCAVITVSNCFPTLFSIDPFRDNSYTQVFPLTVMFSVLPIFHEQ